MVAMARTSRYVSAVVLAVSAVGCSAQQLGFPRTQVSLVSPDGRYLAVVRNQPSIDPPNQSLWVGERNGPLHKVRQLGEDAAWCNLAVWSADSSTVSFMVMDAELVTVDARSRQVISEQWLVEGDDYPPAKMVKGLSLSADGRQAVFRECRRDDSRAGDVQPSDCSAPMRKVIIPR